MYSSALGGKISYYRDRYGLEADAVLHLKDGRYALIEIKLGSFEIESGASHLIEIRNLIRKHNETEKQCPLAEPDLLMYSTVFDPTNWQPYDPEGDDAEESDPE